MAPAILVGVILLLVIAIQVFEPVESTISTWGYQAVSVLQYGFSAVIDSIVQTVNSISELGKLRVEYAEAQRQIQLYQERTKDLLALDLENKRLRQELELFERLPLSSIIAEVIILDLANNYSSIVIDKGSVHGVEKGMAVVSFSGDLLGLVGKVSEAGPLSSLIKPLYDDSMYVATKLQRSRYQGIIHGSGYQNTFLVMSYLDKRAQPEIQYGDLVITSGLGGVFPRDIYIGTVGAIYAEEWETTLRLEIEPIVVLSRMEYVYVLDENTNINGSSVE